MSWSIATTIKRSTIELLLPRSVRTTAGKESQPQSPTSSPGASRPPSPLLEPSALLTPPPLLHAVASASSSRRSVVTHAVLGSEAAGLQSLPHELLYLIVTKLDAPSLCRLSQGSTSCRALADDPLVWVSSPVGHCKETERLRHLRLYELERERQEEAARWRRERVRRWKRRALSVLHAMCGVALILLPLFALLRRRSAAADALAKAPQTLGGASSSHGEGASRLLAGSGKAAARAVDASARPMFEHVVWSAAHGACAAGGA